MISKLKIEIDTTSLDETLEKAKQLRETLSEIEKLNNPQTANITCKVISNADVDNIVSIARKKLFSEISKETSVEIDKTLKKNSTEKERISVEQQILKEVQCIASDLSNKESKNRSVINKVDEIFNEIIMTQARNSIAEAFNSLESELRQSTAKLIGKGCLELIEKKAYFAKKELSDYIDTHVEHIKRMY